MRQNLKNCKQCSDEFIANHGKQQFCSDACRVAYTRKNAKSAVEKLKEQIPGIKTGAEIVFKKPSAKNFDVPKSSKVLLDEAGQYHNLNHSNAASLEYNQDALIGKALREFCEKNKSTVDDFMKWAMDTFTQVEKPKKSFGQRAKEQDKEGKGFGARYDRRKVKLGF